MSTTVNDLSTVHSLISDFFKIPTTPEEWDQYRLTDEQVAFFKENGYLSNIKLLEEWQVHKLKGELASLAPPNRAGQPLFYYFFSNESGNAGTVLFHPS